MPRLRLPLALVFLLSTALTTAAELARVDMRGIVSHNDVVYQFPAREGWEGLPLGNGTLGAQVWQPEGLMFQLNTPLSGVYGGALCRLHVRSQTPVLAGMKTYRQRLSLYDATLFTEISGDAGQVTAQCFIPADSDALVVWYEDTRETGGQGLVELETWRSAAEHTATEGIAVITDTLKVQGEPDYRFALALAVEGAPSSLEQTSLQVKTSRLRVGGQRFTLWLAVAQSRDPDADVAAQARERLAALRAQGLETVRKAHTDWWARFWDKSFVRLTSDDGVADYLANLWYMHIYAMGAGSRGEVPPKFNGGLWTDNRDEREWGPAYWHWNTQETYWPLFAANHLELHQPYLDMYWKMLPRVKEWSKETWETDGAQYQETIPFNGAMGVWEKARGVHPRLPTPKHVAHANLILSSSAEIAMQFWWHYLYTGDQAFLRERAYPLVKEVVTFFVNYLEKDEEGRYNMYPSNAHETYWSVKNPATDLAALRYLLPVIVKASEMLGMDADLRPIWQERLEHLAPYPVNPVNGAILPYEPRSDEQVATSNAENPELFPIGVFPLITLGSPEYDLGVKTFQARLRVNTYGWTTDSICAARLGLAEPAPEGAPPQHMGLQQLLPSHAEYYQDHPSGLQDYYTRRPAIHPYLEGSGTMATAIGEMLLQSWEGLIRLCPALPQAWSADFRLLAMGGFEVTARAKHGKVVAFSLLSQRGEKARVVNPFGGPAVVTCENKPVVTSAEAVLEFPTEPGKTYLVTRAGTTPRTYEITAAPNDAPKHLSPDSKRWIGKPLSEEQLWQPPEEPDAPQPPAPVASLSRPASPDAPVTRFAEAPTIDGDLSEPVWQQAKSLGPFFLLGTNKPARQQTDVYLGCDARALYLGIVCWEAQMAALMVEHKAGLESRDRNVYQDDSVEVFVQPPGSPPWHFAVNALGAMMDSRGWTAERDDLRLNVEWQAATSRRSNRWIVEMAIPFSSLAPEGPYAGEEWRLNVCRNEKPFAETSTWAPLSRAAFHLPDEFGRLVLPDLPARPARVVADPDLVGYWDFETLQGNWVLDASGHGHAGLMTVPLRQVEGKIGRALEFTGAGFVDIAPTPDLNLAEAMTLAVWVMPKAVGSMRIIDKGPAGGSDGYMLDTHPANNIRVVSRPVGVMLSDTLPDNQWSHLAVTLGGGVLRVYLNGRPLVEKTDIRAPLTPTDLPLRLGADSQGWNRFVGLMDEVRIYRRALSAEEVGEVMQGRH